MDEVTKKFNNAKQENIGSKQWQDSFEKDLSMHIESTPIGEGVTVPNELRPNGIRNAAGSAATGQTTRMDFGIRPLFTRMRFVYALVVIVLVVGSLSGVAQASVPGDTLYGWKRNVNEKVGSVLAVGAESQAEYEVKLASRRLQELETVAGDEKKIADDVHTQAILQLQTQLALAEEKIAKLEAENELQAQLIAELQTIQEQKETVEADLEKDTDETETEEDPTPEPTPVKTATPAATPAPGISATGSVSDKGLVINWTVRGIDTSDGFKVVKSKEINPTYGEDSSTYISDGSKRSHTISVKDGKTYYVRVCRYTGDGCDFYSQNIQLTAPTKPTPTPVTSNVRSITLDQGNTNAVVWNVDGSADNGVKVVYSKNPSPTYPPRDGDRSDYINKSGSHSHTLSKFDGEGTYYVRVCEYLGNSTCGVYSNQITIELTK